MQFSGSLEKAEKAADEIFSSARARYYLLAMIGVALMAAIGAAMAAIWLGLVLLVEESRKALCVRLALPEPSPEAPLLRHELALGVAFTAALASGPAIAWFSHAPAGPALGVAMLGALCSAYALGSRRRASDVMIECTPFAAAATAMALDAAAAAAPVAGLGVIGFVGFVFVASLRQATLARRAAAHAAHENAELLSQLNAALGASGAVAWEIDYERRAIAGAERLVALIGAPISFESVCDSALIAAPEDRGLVRGAFGAGQAGMRRFAIEHALNGQQRRVRHEGAVRTTPDGAPVKLTCITRLVDGVATGADAEAALRKIAREIEKCHSAQIGVLKALSNNLSGPVEMAPGPEPLSLQDNAPLSAVCARVHDTLADMAVRRSAIGRAFGHLAEARMRADSSNMAKSQFLANMSHELRTPLNAIIGYAEILQEDAEEADNSGAIQDLGRILTASKHLLTLINEVLDLSKIESGRIEVATADFAPDEIINEVVATLRPLAEKNQSRIVWRGAPGCELAHSDSTKLRQCMLNLLSNACKFTRGGLIEIDYARGWEDGADQMRFTVRDTGIGMTPEQMARLFQPFSQADSNIAREFGGTGLGLTITRRLAQLLGGEVEVFSIYGEGSTFTLRLPADHRAHAAAAAGEIDARQGPDSAPLVLVIEDEPDARELSSRALTRAGFAVQGVSGGETGLTMARALKPSLVLLDIFLPDRSGWRVLQALKSDPATSDIPVIVLSVNEERSQALSLGAAEHLVKPADRDALAAAAMRFARKRHADVSLKAAPAAPIALHKRA